MNKSKIGSMYLRLDACEKCADKVQFIDKAEFIELLLRYHVLKSSPKSGGL